MGDGDNIHIWEDAWIPDLPQFKLITPKPVECQLSKVNELIDKENVLWNLENTTHNNEYNTIKNIPISKYTHEDALVWHFSKDGKFRVKSAYGLTTYLENNHENAQQTPDMGQLPQKKCIFTFSGVCVFFLCQ